MHVPKGFWSYGALTALYLINRLPSCVLDFKSPLEILQFTSPKLAHLKVFGCSCFVHLPSSKQDKLDFKAVKCIFLGYSQTQKGYRCYDSSQKKMYVSRDVRFFVLFITLPQVKKRLVLTCFRCLVLVIMIRIYVHYRNRFLEFQILEISPLLINLLPPLLQIF